MRYSGAKKRPSRLYKQEVQKVQKIDIFPKGLAHGFGPKMAIFPTFFFRKYRLKKVVYDILERKNAFLGYKNGKSKKSKNSHFSKGVNPWFWCKNGYFSNFFFLGNMGHENGFCDTLERTNAFLGYINKKFKKSKNWRFYFKGFIHGFRPKMAIFPTFFFRQSRTGKWRLRQFRAKKRLSRL